MVTWKDTLARIRASRAVSRLRALKAELDAREAEERATRDQLEAEQAEQAAEQAAKEAEQGRVAALQWVETADYEELRWAARMKNHSERRAMVRGKLAADFSELFAIDLTGGLDDDSATEGFFETIREVVESVDGKKMK